MFSGCRTLEPFAFPDSLTTIGDSAFRDCVKFRTDTLGPNVTSLGYSAFYGCEKLAGFALPDTVREVGDRAFYEQDDIFAPQLIDGIIRQLRAFDDRTLRAEIGKDAEKTLALVERFLHCG